MTELPSREVLAGEALTQCLLREGIKRVFGIPGGYLSFLLDSFARAGLRSIEGRHEGAVGCMAAGYAWMTGQVGVVYTQSGPGTTNALTGIAAGYMDSVPMLLLAAQILHEDYGRDGHQESTGATHCIDQMDIFRSVSGFTARPPTPEALIRVARVALATAQGRRCPAVIELAANLLSAPVAFSDRPGPVGVPSRAVDGPSIERLVEALADAKRPALILGSKLLHRGVGKDLRTIVDTLGVPFAAVDYAKGLIPEDHPLCLGVVGQSGHGSTLDYLSSADRVVALGVRMSLQTTNRYQPALFQHLVQVDDDPAEIGRSMPVDFGVVGDLKASVEAMRSAATRPPRSRPDFSSEVHALREKHRVYREAASEVETSPLSTPRALRALREALPREAIIVSDTGLTAQLTKRHFPVYSEKGFMALYGLAPMGSGLPLAIGAGLAETGAPIVSIIGDGGFLVHAGELNVAAQHAVPLIQIVMVNGGYKQVSDRMKAFYDRSYACDINGVDYAAVARAFGLEGHRAQSSAELKSFVARALESKVPTVIEVPTSGDNLMDIMPASIKDAAKGLFPRRPDWPFPPVQ